MSVRIACFFSLLSCITSSKSDCRHARIKSYAKNIYIFTIYSDDSTHKMKKKINCLKRLANN